MMRAMSDQEAQEDTDVGTERQINEAGQAELDRRAVQEETGVPQPEPDEVNPHEAQAEPEAQDTEAQPHGRQRQKP
jgi:hypothetical protein